MRAIFDERRTEAVRPSSSNHCTVDPIPSQDGLSGSLRTNARQPFSATAAFVQKPVNAARPDDQ